MPYKAPVDESESSLDKTVNLMLRFVYEKNF